MSHYAHHFTVAEARAMLPEIRRAFARIHALLDEIRKQQGDSDGTVTFFSANGRAARVAGGAGDARLSEVQKILGDLHTRGVQVKDLRRGLCDFPYLMPPDDREVFLCWELCESDITHWHTIEGGFAGRTPLDG